MFAAALFALAPPETLVLRSPGYADAAFIDLLQGLEERGQTARLLRLPDAPLREELAEEALLAAIGEAPGPTILVAHGVGGTVAARLVAAGRLPQVEALVLIGVPLPGPWSTPPAASVPDAILFGDPLPALLPSARPDVTALGPQADEAPLAAWATPTLALVGERDNLGPAEQLRPGLPPSAALRRIGRPLRSPDGRDSADLLRDPAVPAAIARWGVAAVSKE